MSPYTRDFIAKLRRARVFIHNGWTQGALARDRNGKHTGPKNLQATCWCLGGALIQAGFRFGDYRFTSRRSVAGWNDDPKRTQTQVLACLDNSIAALQKEQV